MTWREKLKAAGEAVGVQDLHAVLRDNRARLRKGGKDDSDEVVDDVGTFILGDVRLSEDSSSRRTNGSGWLKALLAALIGAAGVGLPLAGYLMSQSTPPAAEDTNTDTAYIIDFADEASPDGG